MKQISYDTLRDLLLYRHIVKWEDNSITLDNGIRICIEETEQDCCASAGGTFEDVVLDAAITYVGDIKYDAWKNDDTCGCSAKVTIMHNRNIICKAIGDADAGNGGDYYSIASFIVKIPGEPHRRCHFVGSEDGEENERA